MELIDYNSVGIDDVTKIISFFPDDNKDISFNLRGNTFQTKNKAILVNYRKQFALKNFNQVSDGMTVFRLIQNRSEKISSNINKQDLLKGLSIIQNLDESDGNIYTYLYNFSKHNLDEFNEMLDKLVIDGYTAQFRGKYIVLDGERIEIYDESKERFAISYDYDGLYSFLFGISLIYGDYHFDYDILKSVKMHLPLMGNVAQLIGLYDNLFKDIKKELGIIIKYNYQKKYFGMNLQVVIDDWEILESFKNYFNGIIDIESVAKTDIMKKFKVDIIEYLKNDNRIENKDEFVGILNQGVLKFLEK